MTKYYILNYDTLISSNSTIDIVRRDLKNSNIKIKTLFELSENQYYKLLDYLAKTNSRCNITTIKSY